MTDRLKGVFVAFDEDIRDDDAEPIINAIRQIRHVLRVEPNVVDFEDWTARERVRNDIHKRLWEALHGKRERE